MRDESQEPPHLSSAELESTIRRLGSKDALVRDDAARVIKGAGITALEPLVSVLQSEMAALRRRQRIGLTGMVLASLCVTGMLPRLMEHSAIAAVIGAVVNFFVILLFAYLMESTRLQKQTAALLLGIEDLRAIGPLIDFLNPPFLAENTKVRALLLPLLHRMRATDAALLEERHRDHFRYVLKHWEHFQIGPMYGTEYMVAVLTALQQVGDARELPFVERIAHPEQIRRSAGAGLHWLRAAYDSAFQFLDGGARQPIDRPRVVRAALETLPYLRQKAEQQQVSNSLLRASDPVAATGDELLRAAKSGAATEPTGLLRPSPSMETE